jgi:hypothetical protein
MIPLKPDPIEDKEIFNCYKKIHRVNLTLKTLNRIEDFIFNLSFKIVNFLNVKITKWSDYRRNKIKDRYNNVPASAFADDFSKYDPNINKLLTLDASKERIYQTDKVKELYTTINSQTNGAYDEKNFKWDLFGHLMKKKSDSSEEASDIVINVINRFAK